MRKGEIESMKPERRYREKGKWWKKKRNHVCAMVQTAMCRATHTFSLSFSLRWPHDSACTVLFLFFLSLLSSEKVAADSYCVCVTWSLHRRLVCTHESYDSFLFSYFSSLTLSARAFTGQAHSTRSAAPRSWIINITIWYSGYVGAVNIRILSPRTSWQCEALTDH